MGSLAKAIEPKSDQLNADDLITGPRTVKITAVDINESAEQKVVIHFEGDNGKPYKPCKTMTRVMAAIWGGADNGKSFIGQSMTLYCDPKVKWGGVEVGGIRISHMTGITADKPLMMTEKRGSRRALVIHPLKVADIKPVPAPDKVKAGTDKLIETLKAHANPVEYIQTIAIAKQMAYLTEHRPELLKQVMDSLLLIDRLIYQVVNAPSLDALNDILTLPDCEALDADDAKKLSDAYATRCTELGA